MPGRKQQVLRLSSVSSSKMSEKRPLEAMEEMVHKLPPVNKKRKKGDKDSAPNINRGPRAGPPQTIRRSHHHGSPGDKSSTHVFNNRRKNSQFKRLPLPRMQSNTV